jgi:hypothetical protein
MIVSGRGSRRWAPGTSGGVDQRQAAFDCAVEMAGIGLRHLLTGRSSCRDRRD